ncbi:MAG: hypothetical protein ACP5VE_13265 [Chthonomonadales bacterium]
MERNNLNRVAAALRRSLVGLRIVRFDAVASGIAHPNNANHVVGRVVAGVELRGHSLFIVLRDGEQPGSLLRGDPLSLGLHQRDLLLHSDHQAGGEWHTTSRHVADLGPDPPSVILCTEHSTAYCVGEAACQLLTAREAAHLWRAVLGASPPPSAKDVKAVLAAHPNAEVGAALALVPGGRHEGSLWRSEVLFLQRISPFTRVHNLPKEALRSIVWEYKRFSPNGRRQGTIIRLDLRDRLWVHGRAGHPCRVCGTLIQAHRQGFGTGFIYFCPKCQGVEHGS